MLPTGACGPKVVAFGGGHGLSATLSALRHVTDNLTAVVTVADDGGSSGRLRSELGILPPGDLRMALSALCDDGEWGQLWRDVLQHRFASTGPLDKHAAGNLLIAALWSLLGDPVEGLEVVGRLLGTHGRVLPVSTVPMDIEADITSDGYTRVVRGQAKVARAPGVVDTIRLIPPDARAEPQVLAAIEEADWAVFGPGSWYTSVIPHLKIGEIREALVASGVKVLLSMNLTSDGETRGMTHADHVRSFLDHGRGLNLAAVVADPSSIEDLDDLASAIDTAGARLVLRQVHTRGNRAKHDSLRFAAALRDAFEGSVTDVDGGLTDG